MAGVVAMLALLGLASLAFATEDFGSPGTPVQLTATDQARFALGADVTGTAVPDVITMANNESPTLDIIHGTGTGALGTVFPYAQTQGNASGLAWSFDVGPIDHQPLAEDIVETQLASSTTDVFINPHTGGGSFNTPNEVLTTPSSGSNLDLALGDFNGDGWDDLVVGADTTSSSPNIGELEVYLNSGAGTYPATASQTLYLDNATGFQNSGTQILNVATGDFTGDGRDDIAVIYYDTATTSEDLAIWIAGPGGVFTADPTHSAISVGGSYVAGISSALSYHLYVGDVNGDGAPDLVWVVSPEATPSGRIDFFENDGSGNFAAPQVITPPAGSEPNASAALLDFTGDGDDDLVFADANDGLLAYQWTGTQLSTSPQVISTATLGFTPSTVAGLDLNGDGVPDLAVFDNGGTNNNVYPLIDGSTPPVYTLPSSQDFGSVPIDTLGAAETFTITNTGPSSLKITSAAATGDFLKTADTCTGQSIAQSASCAITIRFAPTATGARTGSLTLTDNTAAETHTVSLTGTGAAFPSGPAGAAGAPGAAGAAGPAGPAGEIELVTCTTVTKKVKGKTKTSKNCTTQLTSSPQTFTENSARATVTRAGHVYATGLLKHGKLTLHASRTLRAGRYALELTTGSGKDTHTTTESLTVGQTIKIA